MLAGLLAVVTACVGPPPPNVTPPTTTTTPPKIPVVAASASAGHELVSSTLPGIERDCALSTPLANGVTLWVFCDTVKAGSYLVTSTAAVAPAGTPAVPVDYVSPSGWPALFLSPNAGELAAADAVRDLHPYAYAGVQPTSMTTLADGRVVVFYNRMVTLDTMSWQQLGSGVATFTPDPSAPIGSAPLLATRLADDVFSLSEPAFGQAAAYQDGDVYAVGCERTTKPRCYLGRVPTASITSRAAWRFFDGTTWSADLATAAPIDFPDVPNQYAALGLTHLSSGLWALSTNPMPGFTDVGQVSFAPALTGPWTAPQRFDLPSCGVDITTNCYGLQVHGELSDGATLGLTYFSYGTRRTELATVPIS